jgi:hypothetical protein
MHKKPGLVPFYLINTPPVNHKKQVFAQKKEFTRECANLPLTRKNAIM